MLVKIKNYLKLRKLRRDALSLLIINSAEIISAFKDVTDLVHSCLLYTSLQDALPEQRKSQAGTCHV